MNVSDLHDLVAAHALDALELRERELFERHLVTCDRCRGELETLQEAASALAFDVEGPTPPPELRARLLARVREQQPASVVPLARRRWAVPAAAALAAAAAAGAVGLGIWGLSLSRSLESEQSARRAEARALEIVSDPAATRYPLRGADGAIVVTPARAAALVVSRLAAAPSGKTYELWVDRGDAPRPAGLFRGGGDRTIVALERPVPAGALVSVSLERAGGVDRLTGPLLFGARAA